MSFHPTDDDLETAPATVDSDNDDALFEQLEAELEQDGTFDYYRDQKIRAHESALQRQSNLATRFQCFATEKPLLEVLSNTDARSGNYLLVFANETFPACQYLLQTLRHVVEESTRNSYIVYVVDATNAPFLADKLNVKTLPTMIPFTAGRQAGAPKIGLQGLLDNPHDTSSLSQEHLQRYIEHCFPRAEHSDSDSDSDSN